jgi:hypothetical protein
MFGIDRAINNSLEISKVKELQLGESLVNRNSIHDY